MGAWNADFDRLMQRARTNLLARGGEEGFRSSGPGRYRSSWQDNLDGSRMLLPGILRRLRLDGDPVVVLPNRDTLLVVGSEDRAGLRWALEGALDFLDDDPGSLNACPLRLRNYQWEPFRRGSPPAAGAPGAAAPAAGGGTGHQKALLDRRHGSRQGHHRDAVPGGDGLHGRDRPQLHRLVPGHGRSLAAGGRPGAPGLGMGQERGPGLGALGKVQARLSHLLEPVGLFPERYRFREQPGPRQLESLLA